MSRLKYPDFSDWHTHSRFCRHAVANLDDYVNIAIKKNLEVIGLSAHFPYEFLKGIEHLKYQEYAMPLPEIESFINNANFLKKKYKDKINVRVGFEIDYIKEQVGLHRKYLLPWIDQLDFIIGSIHNLQTDFLGLFPFDDSRCLNYYKKFSEIDGLFLQYYATLKDMVSSMDFHFNIIGHFDLPKKFNKHPKNKEKIMDVIIKILEIVKKRGIVVEINSSGLRKPIKEQYPSESILYLINDMDIEVLLGSDAHAPSEVAYNFEMMYDLLRKCGFTKITQFEKFEKSHQRII